jgi:hypothetical protein
MPFCPQCHAEYRPGFTNCKSCDGVALVDKLLDESDFKNLELKPEEVASAKSVGYTQGESGRTLEVDGVQIDPAKIFSLNVAAQIRMVLTEARIASAIVPLDLELPDHVPRFEVVVRPEQQEKAEAVLVELWRQQFADEGLEGVGAVEVDKCPACGSTVPLDQEECPDCGLVVGTGAERAAAAAEE